MALPSLVDVVDVAEVGGRAVAAVGCDDKVVRVVDLVDGGVVAAVVLPGWASALALGDGGELVVCHGVDVALFDVTALIATEGAPA